MGLDPEGIADYLNYQVVANFGSNNVSVLFEPPYSYGEPNVTNVAVGVGPFGVAIEPVLGRTGYSYYPEAFVADSGSNNVSVINVTSGHVVASIPVGADPTGVATDGEDQVYVANSGSNTVSEIEVLTDTVSATIPVGPDPTNLMFDAGANSLFVSDSNCHGSICGPGTVSDVSLASGHVDATVPVGTDPLGIAYDPITDEAWVANEGSNTVSIIGDAQSYSPDHVLQTLNIGAGPTGILSWCNFECYFSLTNAGSDTVSELSDNALLNSYWGTNSVNISLGSAVTLAPYGNSLYSPDIISYTYLALPEGCHSANVSALNCTPTVGGTFHVRVFLNDSMGRSGTSVTVLTVSAIVGLPPTTFYVLVTVLFLAAISVLVVIRVRRRKRRREEEIEATRSYEQRVAGAGQESKTSEGPAPRSDQE